MSKYDKSTVELLRQYVEEHPHQSRFTANDVVHWFRDNWPDIKEGTVRSHLMRMSVNLPGRVNHTLVPGVHDLLYQTRRGEYRRYDPARDPSPIYTR